MSFTRNLTNKNGIKLLDNANKTRLNAPKTASKKVVHKTAETAYELVGNKIAEKIVKPKPVSEANPSNVEEIIISPEEREEILNTLGKVLQKWNTIKHLS